MALFDPPSVKGLKEKAGFIGGLYGQAFLGPPYSISPQDVDELVRSEQQRTELIASFDAAAADVGPDKALRKALKAANLQAESFARLAKRPYGDLPRAAERAVRAMLDR